MRKQPREEPTGAPIKVALGGFGNVARQLVGAVHSRPELRLEIAAVAARDVEAARARAREIGLNVPVVGAERLPEFSRVIVECATYDGFRAVVEPAVRVGAHVVCVSVGALGVNTDLIDLAAEHGATIQIGSGALPGLDIVRAAREATIESVRLHSRILPRSLAKESYVMDRGIDLDRAAHGPVPIFSGSAREAARHFPRHFNVAVALSLAGIGLDRTQVEIVADGRVPGARHTISVRSEGIELEMTSQNFPSPDNDRTSRIVAPSILAALRELNAPLRVGS